MSYCFRSVADLTTITMHIPRRPHYYLVPSKEGRGDLATPRSRDDDRCIVGHHVDEPAALYQPLPTESLLLLLYHLVYKCMYPREAV
jgi:hypothetical protein